MEPLIANYLEEIKIGNPCTFHHLEVFPLFVSKNGGPSYHTLKEALGQQLISIQEVSQSGAVPELKVLNKSADLLLLLDGEELMGAKQNRVLNTSVLLKGNSETIIPVSCTEQGRWSYHSAEFHDSDVIMASKVRLEKSRSVSDSLRREQRHRSDQGAVWDGIAAMHCMANVKSHTGAMKDVYDARKKQLEDYEKAFPLQPGQQGIMVFCGGAVCGLDLLSRQEAFSQVYPKLIRSYAMDSILEHAPQKKEYVNVNPTEFLAAARRCGESRFQSPGLGHDYRYEGSHCVGSVLVYEDHPIHLAFFNVDEVEREVPLAGLNRRRQFRQH